MCIGFSFGKNLSWTDFILLLTSVYGNDLILVILRQFLGPKVDFCVQVTSEKERTHGCKTCVHLYVLHKIHCNVQVWYLLK